MRRQMLVRLSPACNDTAAESETGRTLAHISTARMNQQCASGASEHDGILEARVDTARHPSAAIRQLT
jgi:hypothetical protein